MNKNILPYLLCILSCGLAGCMTMYHDSDTEDIHLGSNGLFIVNEGNFQYGNSSLSFYNPATGSVENEIFFRANGMKLGDVAQSMTIHDNKGWIVVNNSHVIFAINTDNALETGRIENLTSPRYIHFVSDDKAYVTQIWDNRIFIVNPRRYEVTGYITVPGMEMENGSTEQMTQHGQYVYCTCWSYQNRILKIDSTTDEIVGTLTVGIQPNSITTDKYGKLWVLCDGGNEDSPYGYEKASLYKIDTSDFSIEKIFYFNRKDQPSELQLNGTRDRLYWINDDIWSMDVNASTLPAACLIASRGTKYYGLTIDPYTDEVYVADAVDYQQQGVIYRYTSTGRLADTFYAGVSPGAFCWK
ncbi:MAG: YncE family protein [Muribaculaceae bacterium]|nr:YncE family protein [Muribaculaceae bacterium]